MSRRGAEQARIVLIATVGGSCTPLVRSVQTHQPDFVYFICSADRPGHGAEANRPGSTQLVDGDGLVCGGASSIAAQTGLRADQYEKIEISAIDNVDACFIAVRRAFELVFTRTPRHRVRADYTGGTKTMTAALVRAATGLYAGRCELWVVTGERDNLHAVRDGTEAAMEQASSLIVLEDRWHEALRLANGYRYGAALRLLTDLCDPSVEVEPALRARAIALHAFCEGLDLWDRFEFDKARQIVEAAQGIDTTILAPLLTAIALLASLQHGSISHQEAVVPQGQAILLPLYDLLLNARRRKAQQRYDDGLVRLNRVIEMAGQRALWHYFRINVDDVDRDRIPDIGQAQRWLVERNGRIHTSGSKANYDLLTYIQTARGAGTSVGTLFYRQRDGRPRGLSEVSGDRNVSYLVHGHTPVDEATYNRADAAVASFLDDLRDALAPDFSSPKQLPSRLIPQHFSLSSVETDPVDGR